MPPISERKLREIKSIYDTSDSATRDAILQEMRGVDPTFAGFESPAAAPTDDDANDELKAFAQGVTRGVTFGALDLPKAWRPREERLAKINMPIFGDVSYARAGGEIVSMLVPLGWAGKVGRILLRGALPEGAQVGGKIVRTLLSNSAIEREVGVAAIRGAGGLADEAIKTAETGQPFDWKQVGTDAALGLVMGLGVEVGARVAAKPIEKVAERYRTLFGKMPRDAVEKIAEAVDEKRAAIEPEIMQFSQMLGAKIPILAPTKRVGKTVRQLTPPEQGLTRGASGEVVDDRIDKWLGDMRVKKGVDFNKTLLTLARQHKIDPEDLRFTAYVFGQRRGEVGNILLTKDDVIKASEFITLRKKLGIPFEPAMVRGEAEMAREARAMNPLQLPPSSGRTELGPIAGRPGTEGWVRSHLPAEPPQPTKPFIPTRGPLPEGLRLTGPPAPPNLNVVRSTAAPEPIGYTGERFTPTRTAIETGQARIQQETASRITTPAKAVPPRASALTGNIPPKMQVNLRGAAPTVEAKVAAEAKKAAKTPAPTIGSGSFEDFAVAKTGKTWAEIQKDKALMKSLFYDFNAGKGAAKTSKKKT